MGFYSPGVMAAKAKGKKPNPVEAEEFDETLTKRKPAMKKGKNPFAKGGKAASKPGKGKAKEGSPAEEAAESKDVEAKEEAAMKKGKSPDAADKFAKAVSKAKPGKGY